MFKKILKISLIVIVLFSLTFTIACSNTKSSDANHKVRLFEVTHSIFYTPLYVAMEKGFFKDQGLDVELTNANGGDKTMTALVSGSADVILVGTETTIYVYSQNPKDPAINFAQLTQTDGSFLVSREPIKNFTWDMLKGKTLLGQRKGGMPEMVSEYVQHLNGVEPKVDNEIIQNIDYANLGSAFVSGTGDFVQLFEPIASKIELEGKGHVVASFGHGSGKLPYTVFITKQSLIDKNPEIVQKFANAIYMAQQWVNEASLEDIADAITPQFQDFNRDVMLKVLDRYRSQGSWATDPIVDEEEYRNLEKVMEYAGELKEKIPYEAIVNTEFAKKAMEQ
ncbi:ABC transporter substrate-binding protein [Tepidibacillus sp. HK-1]|uniref:ABC transporter substrate-binding protein n=1 Tax=Tepidibacillus sp. HK-1 TaxID=1883407 RepID=UPI0008589FDC|nr:ABC transporter substrate-binding protein [Tepidibacillus sp. HK-1]GBF10843.1 NMT1/THI5 like protein [Tepidibacillus sp. HK-1]